ncbi:MAG: DUF4358 domain-containing protein [Lachnospiraceae bacterium]|nr:DUF4358 domain-containing protein [Lachnospiraceae bacterium]
MFKIKKCILIITLFVFMLMIVSCKDKEKEDETSSGKTTGYTSNEVFEKLSDSMKDQPDMTTVTSADEGSKNVFLIFSEVDFDKVEDFVFSYSTKGLADEIIVVHTKDSADATSVKKDLEKRLQSRKATFEEYNPEEGKKFEGAVVLTQDNCIVLLIGNQAQNGKYEFNKMFDK